MTSSKARRQRKRAERATDATSADASELSPTAPAKPSSAPKRARPAKKAGTPKRASPRTGAARASSSSERFRLPLVLLACAYLVTVWLDGIGSTLPAKLTPRPWLYFGQVAALFKSAGMMVIDYRAEGWSCSDRRWVEVDVRPWFRIDADTKESRFPRALQFYRKERKVMRALEEYVIRSHNGAAGRPTIGGVRFLSLRIPYPELGDRVAPFDRKPLSAYPEEIRHAWYYTPTSRRRERCKGRGPEPKASEERAPSSDGMGDPKDDPKETEP